MRREGIKGRDGDGFGGLSDDMQEMLRKETTMEGIRTALDEVTSGEAVGTKENYTRKVGMLFPGPDLECESGSEGCMGTFGVGE